MKWVWEHDTTRELWIYRSNNIYTEDYVGAVINEFGGARVYIYGMHGIYLSFNSVPEARKEIERAFQ